VVFESNLEHDRLVVKFLCSCGNRVSTSGSIPNPNEWHLIADRDFDIERDGNHFMAHSVLAWVCPAGGRLWVGSGAVRDASRDLTLWEYVPAFEPGGPLRRR
jgi:hypothetical protein